MRVRKPKKEKPLTPRQQLVKRARSLVYNYSQRSTMKADSLIWEEVLNFFDPRSRRS